MKGIQKHSGEDGDRVGESDPSLIVRGSTGLESFWAGQKHLTHLLSVFRSSG